MTILRHLPLVVVLLFVFCSSSVVYHTWGWWVWGVWLLPCLLLAFLVGYFDERRLHD